jgi:hypothetical protein
MANRYEEVPDSGDPLPLVPGSGVLEMHPNGYGFLRDPGTNFTRERTDPFVPGTMIEKFGLREGILIGGMVQLFTSGPASVIGLDRGTLTAGKAGDVTIFSLDREWTFDVNQTESKSKNSPFDGWRFKGGPVATIVAGKLVWQARVSMPV